MLNKLKVGKQEQLITKYCKKVGINNGLPNTLSEIMEINQTVNINKDAISINQSI